MVIRWPKPKDGWRAFAGEVGVIVLGVMIALAANEFVDGMHWRTDVRDFRASVDQEIGFDLAAIDYVSAQQPCIDRRLDELSRWRAEQAAGIHRGLLRDIGRPVSIGLDRSAWDGRTGDLTAHLPTSARTIYADVYDTLTLAQGHQREFRDWWDQLAAFNHATNLSSDRQMELDRLIHQIRRAHEGMASNRLWIEQERGELGVRPSWGKFGNSIGQFDQQRAEAGLCEPILPPARENSA